jgi:hypothetical protein
MVVDALAASLGADMRKLEKSAAVGKGELRGVPVILAKPVTFMNNSGDAVAALARFYKVCCPPSLAPPPPLPQQHTCRCWVGQGCGCRCDGECLTQPARGRCQRHDPSRHSRWSGPGAGGQHPALRSSNRMAAPATHN